MKPNFAPRAVRFALMSGLHRTPTDTAVETALQADPAKTDEQLAADLSITVAEARMARLKVQARTGAR